MFVNKLCKPSLIAAGLALSLSHMAAVRADDGLPAAYTNNRLPMPAVTDQATPAPARASTPAAHARDGLGSMVKGVFTATGDVFKGTAKVTGDVMKGSVKATGEILAGSAKATGDVLSGSAKATGDILKGTAKAGEAACVVTEGAIKGTAKVGEAACAVTEDAIKGSAKATGASRAAAGRSVGKSASAAGTTPGAAAAADADVISASGQAIGNAPAAFATASESTPVKHPRGTAPTPGARAKAEKITNIPYTPEATVATPLPQVIPFDPEAQASTPIVLPTQAKAPVKHQKQRLAKSIPGQSATAPAVPLQTAPAQADMSDSLGTAGTRIDPPSADRSESPSWNVQEPASSSTAFASQYALRTTPLPTTTQP